MKLLKTLICVIIFYPTLVSAQVEVVSAVKNDLVARQVNLDGPCGAFEITKRVAWILRSQGIGLLDKPAGNNCQGYSVDYLVFPDSSGRDILGDGGGENTPAWPNEPSEPPGHFTGRWRAPFDPGDMTTPVPPPPTPPANLEQQILDALNTHEAAEAVEREKAETFRQSVGNEYAKLSKFVGKYIAPALIAFFGGRALAN